MLEGCLKSHFFPFSGRTREGTRGAEREKRDSDMNTSVHCSQNLTLCRESPITTEINQGRAVCSKAMAPLCIVIDCVRRVCGVKRRRGGGERSIQSKIDECLTPRELRQAGSSILVNITFTTVVMRGCCCAERCIVGGGERVYQDWNDIPKMGVNGLGMGGALLKGFPESFTP